MFISHDATRNGAQTALLHFLRWFKANTPRPFSILLVEGGELTGEFQELADAFLMDRALFRPLAWPSRMLNKMHLSAWAYRAQIAEIGRFAARHSPSLVYVNSIASARAIKLLSPQIPLLTHVHESELIFRGRIDAADWRPLLDRSQQFIASSNAVRENLIQEHGIDAARIEVVQGPIAVNDVHPERSREEIFSELGVPMDGLLIMGGGYIGSLKGTDLFVQIARAIGVRKPDAPVYFAWFGWGSPWDSALFEHDVRSSGLGERLRILGSVLRPADYLAAADVFVLPSRQDSYPLVCLEAAALGKPIVCFAGGGGIPEFVEEDCGYIVPYLDIAAFADRVLCLADSPGLRTKMGAAARVKVQSHDISAAGPRFLDIIDRTIAKGFQKEPQGV